ncbi:MAG: hypothetical protein ACM30E_00735 [Nitrososphaerales archaeon]
MRSLARRARLAGTRRQNLELRLSPEESKALADVLDSALQMLSAVVGEQTWSLDEPGSDELSYLAAEGSRLVTLDRLLLSGRLGGLTPRLMEKVDANLKLALGLS